MRDYEENAFIKSMLDEKDPTGYSPHTQPWIGLHKSDSVSWDRPNWSARTVVRYENWAHNEPTDYQVFENLYKGVMCILLNLLCCIDYQNDRCLIRVYSTV